MLKIGEFSKLSNITIKMLRHYDEIGLLVPTEVDKFTGYRYYSSNQLDKANKIGIYKALGFSLTSINELLANTNDGEVLKKHFTLREIELKEENEKLQKQIQLFAEISEKLNNIEKPIYNVVLKTIPSRKVASIRKVVPTYQAEGQLWEQLYAQFQEHNIQVKYEGYSMAIYHDKEYKENDVDIELQETVTEDYENLQEIKFMKTEEMSVASVTFRGSYEQMPEVSKAIAFWMERNDYELKGPMINIFHVSPAQNDNPDEWVTESCYMVKKRGA